MKKTTTFAALLLLGLVPACKTDEQALNTVRLGELRQGMTYDEVTARLGTPRRTEATKTVDGKDRMILYYNTGTFDDTPVVLENGKVVGWGTAAAPR
jgi:hypothetical protein